MTVQKCLDPWMIGLLDDYKVEKDCFLYMHKKHSFFFKLLIAFAIMVVQKCSVPWIFGSLDDYKFKKGFFCIHQEQSFYHAFKCLYHCTKNA